MGYVNDTPPDSRVMEEVSLVMAQAARAAQPKFCYQVMKGELSEDHSSLLLANTRLEVGAIIGKQLGGSHVDMDHVFESLSPTLKFLTRRGDKQGECLATIQLLANDGAHLKTGVGKQQ